MLHIICILLYSYNKLSYRKGNVVKKVIRRKSTLVLLYCTYCHHECAPSVRERHQASVPTSMLSYMIQNTVDVIHVVNTTHRKGKGKVAKKLVFIYRYHNSSLLMRKQQYDCFEWPSVIGRIASQQ